SAKTYANIIAVRAGDETRPEIVALVKALQSDTVSAMMTEKYKGSVVPMAGK
ncbi:MAG: MetQ/NlpA family ABC transporter substrate-binding protein, partial [Ruthenibacterium sp.]